MSQKQQWWNLPSCLQCLGWVFQTESCQTQCIIVCFKLAGCILHVNVSARIEYNILWLLWSLICNEALFDDWMIVLWWVKSNSDETYPHACSVWVEFSKQCIIVCFKRGGCILHVNVSARIEYIVIYFDCYEVWYVMKLIWNYWKCCAIQGDNYKCEQYLLC